MERIEMQLESVSELIDLLKQKHHCHTLILYGSYARGDANRESDVDVLGISKGGEFHRVSSLWKQKRLDVFIYPEAKLPGGSELLRLENAKILEDPKGLAARLMKEVREALLEPVKALEDWDRELRVNWIHKMLERAKRGDLEGHYRLHWLLFDLLENFFAFHQMRYKGSKEAFSWLKENKPELYDLFESAMIPGASFEKIETLVHAIVAPKL